MPVSNPAAWRFQHHFKKKVWVEGGLSKTNEAFSGWCQMERPAETHLFGSRAGQSQPGTRLRCQSQSTWPTCKTGSEQTFTSLQRVAWPPLHRFRLQNMECISFLYSRLNKLPCECWQWLPEMAVWGCVFGRVRGVGGEGQKGAKDD